RSRCHSADATAAQQPDATASSTFCSIRATSFALRSSSRACAANSRDTRSIASPMPDKRLLVISHVYPFPGVVGQQQRVAYKLRALRSRFNIPFLTFAPPTKDDAIRTQLLDFV